MRLLENIFAIGKKYISVRVWFYETKKAMRKRAKNDNVEGMCWRNEDNSISILMSRSGLLDGTLEHEATHVMHFSGIKNQEKQAELVEEVIVWIRQQVK